MSAFAKYGVPLNGQKLGVLHPKQQYRFRVIFTGFGDDQFSRELTAQASRAARPRVSFDNQTVHSYNSTINIFGKHSWEDVTVSLKDDITGAVAAGIASQVQRQFNFFEQTSAVAGQNYKFTMEIHALDGTNADELEKWVLEGCYLTNVVWPEGNYENGGISEIEITVKYDVAVQLAGPNTNGGTVVGGDPFENVPSEGGKTQASI